MRESCHPSVPSIHVTDRPSLLIQDTTALVIQSVGGGIASSTKPGLGGHIALGGIVLQFGMITPHADSTEALTRFVLQRRFSSSPLSQESFYFGSSMTTRYELFKAPPIIVA